MWNEITNQNELERFVELFSNFHDSCIKEFKYTSGAFVDKNLIMYPINDKRNFNIIFQRQFSNPSVVEMEFMGLLKLNMFPANENYTCEIFEATMLLCDDCIYWYDSKKISIDEINDYKGNLICSSKIRWRVADEYIGQQDVFAIKSWKKA